MSAHPANVIDLKAYREQRKSACATTSGCFHPLPPVQHPLFAPAFFFGFWPTWVMTPVVLLAGDLGSGHYEAAEHD